MIRFAISLVFLSFFSFAPAPVKESNEPGKNKVVSKVAKPAPKKDLGTSNVGSPYSLFLDQLYNQINGKDLDLDYELFRQSVTGFINLKSENMVKRNVLTIIDFGKPSTEKRMWIIDLNKKKVLEHTLVAHGKNSGQKYAESFSNTANSNKSSLGFYVTSETYIGKHGLSLRLDGMDSNLNCNARSGAIVLHGANYVSEDFIKCTGRLGRSHGCPAVPATKNQSIIEMVKNGSVIFIGNQKKPINSKYLLENTAKTNYQSFF